VKRSPLKRGTSQLKRSRLKRQSAKRRGEAKTWAVQRNRALDRAKMRCQECGYASQLDTHLDLEVHHLCSRARGVGHVLLHCEENLRVLCLTCHKDAHEGRLPHLIKSLPYLDSLPEEEKNEPN